MDAEAGFDDEPDHGSPLMQVDRLVRPLVVALLAGLLSWLVAGAIGGVAALIDGDPTFSDPLMGTFGPSTWVRVIGFVGSVSLQVSLASLAALAGLRLFRNLDEN